jgi:SAM-dependent methyltransferase
MIPFDLHSPLSGAALERDGRHALVAVGERWPVVDGIPYLRIGRENLVGAVLSALDAGREEDALALLLADGEHAAARDGVRLREIVHRRQDMPLHEAVALFDYGAFGDFLLQRWSDPSFLAGLALLEAHWNAPKCIFELGCGLGPCLRELQLRGYRIAGADIDFTLLWLARNWVLGRRADLICFDATQRWPIMGAPVDLVMCHDAFHRLGARPDVLASMRSLAGEEGWLAVSHIVQRDQAASRDAACVDVDEIDELFPDALIYDDAELVDALIQARAPVPHPAPELRDAASVSVVFGPGMRPAPRALKDGLTLPLEAARLSRNPLYASDGDGWEIRWPSPRYRAAVAELATYPVHSEAPAHALMGPDVEPLARRRELVALPERW